MKQLARICALALAVAASAQEPPPGPYITVYHDDAVAFQFRRDRIHETEPGVYNVWLRWLWAQPRRWKAEDETARLILVDVDCNCALVRELVTLHKDRALNIYDTEKTVAPSWKSFDAKSGAGMAIARLCEFLPQVQRLNDQDAQNED